MSGTRLRLLKFRTRSPRSPYAIDEQRLVEAYQWLVLAGKGAQAHWLADFVDLFAQEHGRRPLATTVTPKEGA